MTHSHTVISTWDMLALTTALDHRRVTLNELGGELRVHGLHRNLLFSLRHAAPRFFDPYTGRAPFWQPSI